MESSVKFVLIFAVFAVLPTPQLAFSIPWSFGYCKNPTYVTDLNVTQFFNGTWYQQKSYGEFLLGDGICPTKKYSLSSAGLISELFYDYETLAQSWASIRGTAYSASISNGAGALDFTYSLGSLGGLFTYTTPVIIVATDYDCAICYACRQSLFYKIEMSWVMTRERNGTCANAVITESGLTMSSYQVSDNNNCPANEPQL